MFNFIIGGIFINLLMGDTCVVSCEQNILF